MIVGNRVIPIGYSEELIDAMHVFLGGIFDLKGKKARTRIFISESLPRTFDGTGYEELDYKEIGVAHNEQ